MSRWKSAAAATICAAAVLAVPATAHAGGTKDPRYSPPAAGQCSDKAAFLGEWFGAAPQGATFNSDGTGRLTLGSNADHETWSLTWGPKYAGKYQRCGIVATLKSRVRTTGTGANPRIGLAAGKSYDGYVGRRPGNNNALLLAIVPQQDSVVFCRANAAHCE